MVQILSPVRKIDVLGFLYSPLRLHSSWLARLGTTVTTRNIITAGTTILSHSSPLPSPQEFHISIFLFRFLSAGWLSSQIFWYLKDIKTLTKDRSQYILCIPRRYISQIADLRVEKHYRYRKKIPNIELNLNNIVTLWLYRTKQWDKNSRVVNTCDTVMCSILKWIYWIISHIFTYVKCRVSFLALLTAFLFFD